MKDTKRLLVRVIDYERASDSPMLDSLAEVLDRADLTPDEAADVAVRVLAPSGWGYESPDWWRAACADTETDWATPVLFSRPDMPEHTYITFCFGCGGIRPTRVQTWFTAFEPDEIIAEGEWSKECGYWVAEGCDQRYIAECDPVAWAREALRDEAGHETR